MKNIATIVTLFIIMSYGFSLGGDHYAEDTDRVNENQEPLLSFAMLTDTHYGEYEPEQTRFYAKSATRLHRAMEEFTLLKPRFMINLGDLCDRDYRSFAEAEELIRSYGIKTYHCLGNHDYSVSRNELRRVLRQTDSSDGYYSFDISTFRFIVLNGNEIASYSHNAANRRRASEIISQLNAEGRPNAREYNGAISDRQLSWLAGQLDESKNKKLNVFIFCHFPVFPEGEYNLLNDMEVLELLKRYEHIIAWFNGHNHQGGYGNYNMIHFVTMRAMVESEESGAWSFVEVYHNRIWIHGSEREKSQILAW